MNVESKRYQSVQPSSKFLLKEDKKTAEKMGRSHIKALLTDTEEEEVEVRLQKYVVKDNNRRSLAHHQAIRR